MTFNKISVIGLGYIGLPTAAMFASRGIEVCGVDNNPAVVDTINRGKIHIVEPGLADLVSTAVSEKFLFASLVAEPADAFLIAVPTPFKDSDDPIPDPDLAYIESAIKGIAKVVKKGDLIILESTSPVGTTESMVQWLVDLRPDLSFPVNGSTHCDVNVAHCPERVLPGQVIRELVGNDRIIGGITDSCSARATELYSVFVEGDCISTNARTAEMTKLTENSCRDVQIAFANELSMICEKLEIDVQELISLANRHPRINILQPGPGVGGHCIAVDPWFIISKSPDEAQLIHTARRVNIFKMNWVVDKIKAVLAELSVSLDKPISQIKVAYFGLAFKPNIDDLRESPALQIVNEMKNVSSNYVCVEPNINDYEGYEICSLDYAVEASDLMVLLVKHDEFIRREVDITASKVKVLDFCGILSD